MNRIQKKGAMVLGALCLAGAAQGANHQMWLKQTIEGSPVKEGDWKGLQVKVEQEEKFNEKRFIDSETLVMLGWKMNPYLSVYLGDRWVYERSVARASSAPSSVPRSTSASPRPSSRR